MPLTTAQYAALKNDIANDATFGQLPHTADNADLIATAYNLTASPNFYVWRTNVNVPDIFDQVNWANYTPNDAPDNTVTYQNRAMLLQIKQTNLQLMLVGRDTINAGKSNERAGLADATQNLPSGASGALKSGGWANILPILSRTATRAEKLFANVSSGSGADQTAAVTGPATMRFEGTLTYPDVLAAWNS